MTRTYRDPLLSIWQSAAHDVSKKHKLKAGALDATQTAKFETAEKALLAPAQFIGEAFEVTGKLPDIPDAVTDAASDIKTVADDIKNAFVNVAPDCAKAAAKFLKAEIIGDKNKAATYAGILHDAPCNAAGWAECLETYLAYKATFQSPQYRPNQKIVRTIPNNATIAIIGDWGTGEPQARSVLNFVATFNPDILLHLGDVYFAGTQNEANDNFLGICKQTLPKAALYSLCGNHDMYSGGQGYYWLLDQIGQTSSYFCLKNDSWLFTAMDTGYNDRDPITVTSNMTTLYNKNGWNEADWHLDNIKSAIGKKKIGVFSHHQLFSPFGPVGSGSNGSASGINTNLLSIFGPVMANIDIWFWGHEHTLALYDNYQGLKRSRCVGASAIPVFTNQQSYTVPQNLFPAGTPAPTWNKNFQLGNSNGCYNNAFAIMKLNGSTQASVDYYQVTLNNNLQQYTPTEYI